MDTVHKSDKVCISKSVGLFAVVAVILGGVILFSSYISKQRVANNTRAANPQCIYETMQECKADGCTGLCTKGGCGTMLYQCKTVAATSVPPTVSQATQQTTGTCVPYGSEFKTTSKGVCWSIGSKSHPWKKIDLATNSEKDMFMCINELAKSTDKSKCPAPLYCDKTYTYGKSAPWNTFLMEMYIGGEKNCSGTGIEVSGTEFGFGCNIIGPESSVDGKQCNLKKYTCNGEYKVVAGECYNLRSRKCQLTNSGFETPACCSDIVDMHLCKK